MELRLLGTQSIPDGSIVSIRLGGVRRQALLGSDRPYRFSKVAHGKQPLRVDVFAPVAHARLLVEAAGRSHCSVPLDAPLSAGGSDEAANHGCGMRLDFELESFGRSSLGSDKDMQAPVEEDAPPGMASQPYYEQHRLGDFFQMLLQSLLQDRPPDPCAYLARLLQNSVSACTGYQAPDAAGLERCADTGGSGGCCAALASTMPLKRRSPRIPETESLGRLARAASAGQLHQGSPAISLRRHDNGGSCGSGTRPRKEGVDRRQRPPMLVSDPPNDPGIPVVETSTPGSRDDAPRSGGTGAGSALRASSRPERRRTTPDNEACVAATPTPVARLRNQRSRLGLGARSGIESDEYKGHASAGLHNRNPLSPIAAESGADDDGEDVEDADAEEAEDDALFGFDALTTPQRIADAACRAVGIADEVMAGQRPMSEASEATLVGPGEDNGSTASPERHALLPDVLSAEHDGDFAAQGPDALHFSYHHPERAVDDLAALARDALVRAGSGRLAESLESVAPVPPPRQVEHTTQRVLSIRGETSALLSRTAELETRMQRFEAEREDLRAAIKAHLSTAGLPPVEPRSAKSGSEAR